MGAAMTEAVYLASVNESVWHRVSTREVSHAALALCGRRLSAGEVHLRRGNNPPMDDDPRGYCLRCRITVAETTRTVVFTGALVSAAMPATDYGWPSEDMQAA